MRQLAQHVRQGGVASRYDLICLSGRSGQPHSQFLLFVVIGPLGHFPCLGQLVGSHLSAGARPLVVLRLAPQHHSASGSGQAPSLEAQVAKHRTRTEQPTPWAPGGLPRCHPDRRQGHPIARPARQGVPRVPDQPRPGRTQGPRHPPCHQGGPPSLKVPLSESTTGPSSGSASGCAVGCELRGEIGALQREILDLQVTVRFQRRRYAGKRRYANQDLRVVGVRNPRSDGYHLYVTNIPPNKPRAEDVRPPTGPGG